MPRRTIGIVAFLSACGGIASDNRIDASPDGSRGDETVDETMGVADCGAALAPVVLASDDGAVTDMAVSASRVFFAKILSVNNNLCEVFQILSVPRCGGQVEVMADRQGACQSACCTLYAVQERLYWSSYLGLSRIPTAGGPITVLSPQYGGLVTSGSSIYTNVENVDQTHRNFVYEFSTASLSTSLIASDATLLGADSQNYYLIKPLPPWATDGPLVAVSTTAPGETQLLAHRPKEMLSDGKNVYMTYTWLGTSLYRIAVNGGQLETVTPDAWYRSLITIDQQFVYGFDDQTIARAPKSGGPSEIIATIGETTDQSRNVTFVGDEMYWLRRRQGTWYVMKSRRP